MFFPPCATPLYSKCHVLCFVEVVFENNQSQLLLFLSESKIRPFSFSENAGNNLLDETFLEGSHKDEGELGTRAKVGETHKRQN